MQRVGILFILLALIVTACQPAPTAEPPPDALQLLTQAASKICAIKTFRMTVERTGMRYYINTDYGGAEFRRAEIQYVTPETVQARARVLAAGLPIDLEFFFQGTQQWLRGIWTNNAWVPMAFVPGFTPAVLLAEDSGFQAAIKSLTGLKMVGREQLVDGTPVYHITATAPGEAISAFMAGLIEVTGQVMADVFIHTDLLLPVRFVIVQPESVSETEPDPTTWVIELFDFDAPAALDTPETTAETTPEATSEATAAS